MAFTKLDCGITESTIWQAPDTTRLVWITLLARADQNGYVGASMPGLAGLARVSLDDCIVAITTLEAPDIWSRTKEHEGRRIAPADGGWVLLNHAKYRAMQSADDRRERSRLAMATLRNKRKQLSCVNAGEQSYIKLSQAEAEAEATKKDNSKTTPASRAARGSRLPIDWEPGTEGREFAISEGITGHVLNTVARTFVDYWIAQPGAKGVKLNWAATWRNWCRNTRKPITKPEVSGAVPIYKHVERQAETPEQRALAREVLAEARRRIKSSGSTD